MKVVKEVEEVVEVVQDCTILMSQLYRGGAVTLSLSTGLTVLNIPASCNNKVALDVADITITISQYTIS